MASYFYNGVLLPEIPSDALKNYPYCWIRYNIRTGYYDLLMAKSPWWQSDSTTIYTASYADGIQWYRTPITEVGSDWTFNQSWTTNGGMANESDRAILWANQNIPVGAVTATTIYFVGSSAVPDEESYKIKKDTVVGLADQVRRLCKTEATLTPAQMESKLGDLNIELMDLYVTSTTQDVTYTPEEGYYGFSKVVVGGVDFGGGGGGSGDGGDDPYVPPDAGNTSFGYETTENEVLTGYKIYDNGVVTTRFKGWLNVYPYVFAYYNTSQGWIEIVQSELPILYDADYSVFVVSGSCNYWLGTYHTKSETWSDSYSGTTDTTVTGKRVMNVPTGYNWRYSNHDIYNEDTGALYMASNAENLTIETEIVKVETPVEVEDEYTVSGENMNELIALAQKITGRTDPMTLEEAIAVLEEYYASLNDESAGEETP